MDALEPSLTGFRRYNVKRNTGGKHSIFMDLPVILGNRCPGLYVFKGAGMVRELDLVNDDDYTGQFGPLNRCFRFH
ncbi:hypothetical protein CEXT_547231 [Caerostris extrusa]|uniref:Uncharacterized protein n=1 Tax=Caerostris extrusa TaxID=172846 RepID=A0AAV4VIJ7_CAEEX|nr:hypothetical protein CEXT_547231 [Caerostris extrusa]